MRAGDGIGVELGEPQLVAQLRAIRRGTRGLVRCAHARGSPLNDTRRFSCEPDSRCAVKWRGGQLYS